MQQTGRSRNATPSIPVSVRRPLDLKGGSLMMALCLALGFQQMAIKAVAVDIAPLAQITLRSAMAALFIVVLAFWQGIRLTRSTCASDAGAAS